MHEHIFPTLKCCFNLLSQSKEIMELDLSEDANIGEMQHSEAMIYSPQVSAFTKACYENGFVLSFFDWDDWGKRYINLVEKAQGLDNAKINDIAKILTVYLRGDHMSTGYLFSVMKSGMVKKILDTLYIICNSSNLEMRASDAISAISDIIEKLK